MLAKVEGPPEFETKQFYLNTGEKMPPFAWDVVSSTAQVIHSDSDDEKGTSKYATSRMSIGGASFKKSESEE
jgi:hypothetical protein